jgi:hypothetical protein
MLDALKVVMDDEKQKAKIKQRIANAQQELVDHQEICAEHDKQGREIWKERERECDEKMGMLLLKMAYINKELVGDDDDELIEMIKKFQKDGVPPPAPCEYSLGGNREGS